MPPSRKGATGGGLSSGGHAGSELPACVTQSHFLGSSLRDFRFLGIVLDILELCLYLGFIPVVNVKKDTKRNTSYFGKSAFFSSRKKKCWVGNRAQ